MTSPMGSRGGRMWRWWRSQRNLDRIFLGAIVALSAAPYVTRLGFYSDDWAFIGVFSTATDHSIAGLIREQFGNPNLAMRPTQAVYQAVLFRLSNVDPLGYHMVNLAMLIVVALLLYAVIRRVSRSRTLAVAVTAVYVLMPNHATNRFWFASFGYVLGMALYLASLSSDLRAASSERRGQAWRWKALALIALAFASLGYEVVLPLVVMNIVLAEWVARRIRKGGLQGSLGPAGRMLFHGGTLAVAAAAIVLKVLVAPGIGTGASPVSHILGLATGTLGTNFGTYGVALPHTVAWSFPHAGIAGAGVAAIIGVATYRYLAFTGERENEVGRFPRSGWQRMAAFGMAVFILGYSIFLVTGRIGFSSTGTANRVAAAAALGSSIVLVAVIGWAASWLATPTVRDRIFRGGVAILCLSGVLVVNGLASFWIRSWRVQEAVLADVRAALPEPPLGTTVLLDGVCPYVGPAVVFESSWDLQGALRTQHRDRSLSADVTSGDVSVEPRGVVTRIYAQEAVHAYGEALYLLDPNTGEQKQLTDQAAARRSLARSAAEESCPAGRPGAGTVVLPIDALVNGIQNRLGR